MNRAEGSEYPLFQKLTPRLEDVLEYWTARGTTCKKHGGAIYGDHCPKCYPEHSLVRTVLPSPREALVRQLGKAGLLTLDRLIELCNDQRDDVKQAAARLAATKAAEENAISDLLARVDSGELPDHILCEIVALPTEALHSAKDDLVSLLHSNCAHVKEVIMSALARGGWIDLIEAKALARATLRGDDPGVRDRALETLRTLGGRQE